VELIGDREEKELDRVLDTVLFLLCIKSGGADPVGTITLPLLVTVKPSKADDCQKE
jgi:hypothetical protein